MRNDKRKLTKVISIPAQKIIKTLQKEETKLRLRGIDRKSTRKIVFKPKNHFYL